MTGQICFLLNDRQVCTPANSGLTVLDYLHHLARLRGTKVGCREGGCGACTLLVGSLRGEKVSYQSVASCLLPLGELQGKHLVTIEGLNQSRLSPVQQELVDRGATQCGFCTPGMVMSLTGYLLKAGTKISFEELKNALGGNLCRCTGYASIKRACNFLVTTTGNSSRENIQDLVAKAIVPEYFQEIPARLRQLSQSALENGKTTADFLIAGGTEIYVNYGDILPESRVKLLNQSPQMKRISSYEGKIYIKALTTFAEFATDPTIVKLIPDIQAYVSRIASWQIRNRATLGGNIVAASPIADGSILLLALDSLVMLNNGNRSRILTLKEFFQGYKQTAQKPGEILSEIIFPAPQANKINFEKVSKRKYFDCAVVNSAIKIRCENDVIREIAISMGGVAPIPLFLKQTSNYFIGKPVSQDTIETAFPILQREISPISDVHGSAGYKRLLARQLLIAHFSKLFPDFLQLRDFYTTN